MERNFWLGLDKNSTNEKKSRNTRIQKYFFARNTTVMTLRPYQQLVVWKESYSLCLCVLRLLKKFPPEERFCLAQQMRKAATSVPINIAEGNTKRSVDDRSRFFEISLGSLNELHCESLIARDLRYITIDEFHAIDDRIQRVSYLLNKLIMAITPRKFFKSPRVPPIPRVPPN